MLDEIRWDEKAGLRRDAVRSQVIDALKAQEITGLLVKWRCYNSYPRSVRRFGDAASGWNSFRIADQPYNEHDDSVLVHNDDSSVLVHNYVNSSRCFT